MCCLIIVQKDLILNSIWVHCIPPLPLYLPPAKIIFLILLKLFPQPRVLKIVFSIPYSHCLFYKLTLLLFEIKEGFKQLVLKEKNYIMKLDFRWTKVIKIKSSLI